MSDVLNSDRERNLRRGAECALVSVFPDCGECVCDDGDEEVDEPEVQYYNAYDEEETRDEEFRVHHVVHQRGPLHVQLIAWARGSVGGTYTVRRGHDKNLQGCIVDSVEAFYATERIATSLL